MIKVGDLVMLKNAKIRGPDGNLKELEESPYYGIIISINVGHPAVNNPICRVLWFDQKTGARTGNEAISLELTEDLEVIS